jgi:hypothetical protein
MKMASPEGRTYTGLHVRSRLSARFKKKDLPSGSFRDLNALNLGAVNAAKNIYGVGEVVLSQVQRGTSFLTGLGSEEIRRNWNRDQRQFDFDSLKLNSSSELVSCGDRVLLHSTAVLQGVASRSKETSRQQRIAHVNGFSNKNIGCAEVGSIMEMCPGAVSECLFRIVGCPPYHNLCVGDVIQYGMPIKLQHCFSGAFLGHDLETKAKLCPANLDLTLVGHDNEEAHTSFQILPRFHVSLHKQTVAYNDQVRICTYNESSHDEAAISRNHHLRHGFEFSSPRRKSNKYERESSMEIFEVSLAPVQERTSSASVVKNGAMQDHHKGGDNFWKIVKYSESYRYYGEESCVNGRQLVSPQESTNAYLQCGHAIRLFHSEEKAFLSSSSNAHRIRFAFLHRSASDMSPQVAKNVFVIEQANVLQGGTVHWGQSIRLRHFGSDAYLTLQYAKEGGTPVLNPNYQKTRTVVIVSGLETVFDGMYYEEPGQMSSWLHENERCQLSYSDKNRGWQMKHVDEDTIQYQCPTTQYKRFPHSNGWLKIVDEERGLPCDLTVEVNLDSIDVNPVFSLTLLPNRDLFSVHEPEKAKQTLFELHPTFKSERLGDPVKTSNTFVSLCHTFADVVRLDAVGCSQDAGACGV